MLRISQLTGDASCARLGAGRPRVGSYGVADDDLLMPKASGALCPTRDQGTRPLREDGYQGGGRISQKSNITNELTQPDIKKVHKGRKSRLFHSLQRNSAVYPYPYLVSSMVSVSNLLLH